MAVAFDDATCYHEPILARREGKTMKIEEIDGIGKSKGAEAAEAAYAAMLAATPTRPVVEEPASGGGGQALPDAVVVMGQRDASTERLAKLREAAAKARAGGATAQADQVQVGTPASQESSTPKGLRPQQSEATNARPDRLLTSTPSQASAARESLGTSGIRVAQGTRRTTDGPQKAGKARESDPTFSLPGIPLEPAEIEGADIPFYVTPH